MSAPSARVKLVVRKANQQGSEERSRTMIIIGVDFHPEFQEIASVDTDTGEYQEKHLAHPNDLAATGVLSGTK
jgi:hypothetical protein